MILKTPKLKIIVYTRLERLFTFSLGRVFTG